MLKPDKTTTQRRVSKEECDAKGVCYQELDALGTILDVNQAWLELAGRSRDNVIGRFAGEFVSSESMKHIEKNFPILKDYGEVNHVHFRFVCSNKTEIDVLLFGQSEYSDEHNFIKTHCWFAPLDYFSKNKSTFLSFLNDMKDLQTKLHGDAIHLDWAINSLNAFVITYEDTNITNVNKAVLDFFDCKTIAEFTQKIPPSFKKHLLKMLDMNRNKSLLHGEPSFELVNTTSQEIHFFDCQVTPIIYTENQHIIVLNDISETVKAQRALNYERELSEKYLEVAKVIMIALDTEANIKMINASGTQLLGYSKEEIIGKNWFDLIIDSDNKPSLQTYFKSIIQGDVSVPDNFENTIIAKDGSKRSVHWKNTLLTDDFGNITGTLSSALDITELKASQKQLEFLALHDPLTGLDNRQSLEILLDQSIKNAHRNSSLFAVCFIDLDNFKYINDRHGHKAGDELLIAVSKRIKDTIRESDTIARFGGDEFVILLDKITHENEIIRTVEKLIRAFNTPLNFAEHSMLITMSMGVSVYPNDANQISPLLQNADMAMYEAKQKGKNQYALYNQKMAIATFNRAQLINDLTAAISEDQFVMHYQPQIDQLTQKVVGIEALVRWDHPERGLVLPDDFIPVAEEAGLIISLGEKLLRKACLDITHLHNETAFNGHVAINISGVQIESQKFFSMLEKVLTETCTTPSSIEIEITESVVMSNPEQWVALFKKLKTIGLKIAIDDFGTGYSSLSHLSRLPLDKLKIDKSFIQNITTDSKARTVAQAIINLSHSMNMTTIAEGIETEAQKTFIAEQNCSVVQGFLFAKPMPLSELKAWLNQFEIKSA